MLASFVQSFWHFENKGNEIRQYSILPDGCFDLILYFEDQAWSKSVLTGLWNQNVDVSLPVKADLWAIRFKPLAAEYILGKSLVALLNSTTTISNNEGIGALLCTEYQDFDTFVASNSAALETHLTDGRPIDPRKKIVFDLLFESQGDISIKTLSERATWSNRQISRYFKKNLGITAKEYANILRVHAAYKDLAKGIQHPQTAYYDQSHFIKEVKKYTGEQPKTLAENKNDRFLQLSTKDRD